MGDAQVLRSGLDKLGVAADGNAVERLLAYAALVRKWSAAYNLVSTRDLEQFVVRHVLDCAAVLPAVQSQGEVTRLFDAGSGAGLPGVPLAILDPVMHCTLIDSAGKKVRFLRHVRRTLQLFNTEPVHARLEDWVPAEPPQVIISRAFKSLLDFGNAVRHLVAPGTRLLAMKGRLPEAELSKLPDWLELLEIRKIDVPQLQAERHLVIMAGSAA